MKGLKKENICIRQHDNTDCAAACLCSILGYWGLKVPLIEARHACGVSQRGTSIHSITIGAKKFGMDAYGASSKSKEILELKEIDTPVILHLKKENGWLHFVVYYGYKGEKALIMDPDEGKIVKISFSRLSKLWSGYIVCVTPSVGFTKGDRTKGVFSSLLTLMKGSCRELALSAIGAIAFVAISYSFSLFLQHLIDTVIPAKDIDELTLIGGILLIITFIIGIITSLRGNLLLRASLKTDCSLITSYLRKLSRVPLPFFDSHTAAELNSRITDAYRVRSFVAGRSILFVANSISLILSAIILIYFNLRLALISFSFTPLFLIIYYISNRVNEKYNKRIIESAASFQECTIETLNNIRSIKHFNASNMALSKMELAYTKQCLELYKGGKARNFLTGISEIVSKLTVSAILVTGGLFCIKGELSMGELVSFYTISGLFISTAIMLIESNYEISQARISAKRLFEIFDIEDESAKEFPLREIPQGDIKFENIGFAYPGSFTLFDNFSTEIKRGEINIIKGRNGSGKSTLAKLLTRDYLPDKGRISIGEIDISLIDLEIWREKVGIVSQTPELSSGSILENIVMGRELNMEKVQKVCKQTDLTHIIKSHPEGLLSDLGEGGIRLSGGERSKICLARTLYSSPEILIIDEGTSHLDSENKEFFCKIIEELHAEGITIILITHEERDKIPNGNIITIDNKDAHHRSSCHT